MNALSNWPRNRLLVRTRVATRGLLSETPAGSRSRQGDGHDRTPVAPHNALFPSYKKRLARILLLLANFGKDGRPEPIIAKISQETLADMIGTTRSRVSFFMNKFRELGFVDYNGGQIEVHSSLLNMVLHEKPEISS